MVAKLLCNLFWIYAASSREPLQHDVVVDEFLTTKCHLGEGFCRCTVFSSFSYLLIIKWRWKPSCCVLHKTVCWWCRFSEKKWLSAKKRELLELNWKISNSPGSQLTWAGLYRKKSQNYFWQIELRFWVSLPKKSKSTFLSPLAHQTFCSCFGLYWFFWFYWHSLF